MTAIMTGAACRAPIWVVMTPGRISENGAATSAPGRAQHRRDRKRLRQPRDQHVSGHPGRAADEHHHEERPTE